MRPWLFLPLIFSNLIYARVTLQTITYLTNVTDEGRVRLVGGDTAARVREIEGGAVQVGLGGVRVGFGGDGDDMEDVGFLAFFLSSISAL
jgi:hypothetical protein